MSMPKTPLSVRKYGNRKLYDEEAAAYISMLALSDIVAGGRRVVVVCDLTGKDLTLEVLARAFYERVQVRDVDRIGVVPVELERLMAKVHRKDSE